MKVNNEIKIGIMVTLVAAILVMMTFKAGDYNFTKKNSHQVKIHFKDLDGVDMNSPVMFNGYDVGFVDQINILDDPSNEQIVMELVVWIRNDAKLREGTKACIKPLGFMGEKYVGLTSDNKGGYLPEGAIIEGEQLPGFTDLAKEGKAVATEILEITKNINERLETNKENVDQTLTSLNGTMKSLNSISANVDERLQVNKIQIDSMMSNFSLMSKNLEELSYDLKINPWKILYKSNKKE